LLLPLLTSVLLFCSFPKINLGFLAWIALVPLLLFLARAPNMRMVFLGSLAAFWLEAFLLTPWIPSVLIHYGGIGGALAWLLFVLMAAYLACFPSLACLATRFCMDRAGSRYLLIFPVAWLTMEYAISHFLFGGFPWLLIGYSQTSIPLMMQAADLAGVYGISLLVVIVNASLALWLLDRKRQHGALPAMVAGVLVLACLAYGMWAKRTWGNLGADFKVAMLQGNISVDDPGSVIAWKAQKGYEEMAQQLRGGSYDLLLLPESPSPAVFDSDESYRNAMQRLAGNFPMGMIFNNIATEEGGSGFQYFNSAYFISADGRKIERYDKIHLVPFGEYIPWREFFFFAHSITQDVGAFSAGSQYLIPSVGDMPVNAVICFEAVFPDLVRRFVNKGSRLIINLTNDAWYGDSAAPYQHLAIARWRAVENRRFLLRAANSGISAVIAPTGEVKSATRLLQKDICRGHFAFVESQSLYARLGDVLLIPCVIMMLWAIGRGCLARDKQGSRQEI
jgi:apolipoprotein N-acyltransferase